MRNLTVKEILIGCVVLPIMVIGIILWSGLAKASGEWTVDVAGSGHEVKKLDAGGVAYFVSSGTSTTDSNVIQTRDCGQTRITLFQSSGAAGTGYVMEASDRDATYTVKILKDTDFDGLLDDLPLDGNPLNNLEQITLPAGALFVYIDVQTAAGAGKISVYSIACIGNANR